MKISLFLGAILLMCLCTCLCSDLIVGTSYNASLAWQHRAEYFAIPFKERVKELFYVDPVHLIKGIIIRDLDNTDASAIITAGGVGAMFANVRLKSERGKSLAYQMEIYV